MTAADLVLATLVVLAEQPTPTTDPDLVSHALIQLVGSGGLGGVLVILWNALRTKLDAIKATDLALEQRIKTMDKDLGGRLDALQTELARKANADSVGALEDRLRGLERAQRERSRRLTRVEAHTGLLVLQDSPGEDAPKRRG